MKGKIKICLIAYCRKNLGDDLFILQLAKTFPKCKFFLLVKKEYNTAFRDVPNIICPSYLRSAWNRIALMLGIKKGNEFRRENVNCTVAIGGSMFLAPPVAEEETTILKFKDTYKDCFVIGCNFETDYSENYLCGLREVIENTRNCCFRDNYSYNLVCDLKNVSCAPDVLYAWDSKLEFLKGEGIGISVISAEKRSYMYEHAHEYYESIIELCSICEKKRIPVKLLGFCEAEGDANAIREIVSRLKKTEYVSTYVYNGNVPEMMKQLNSCETIIATRFHAMILGWTLHKNVVPIIYSNKQTHVLQDAGFDGAQWRLIEGERMSGEQLFRMSQKKNGYLDIKTLGENAKKQFEALHSFIAKI